MAPILTPSLVRQILGLLFVVFTAYWIGSWAYDHLTSRAKAASRYGSLTSSASFILVFILAAILLILLPRVFITRLIPFYSYLAAFGILVAVSGVCFAIWARRHLGGNWSGRIMLKKGHTLVTTGPYSIVRHPIYTGIAGFALGGFVALGDIFGLFVLLGTLICCFLRIKAEERLMQENFGKEYVDYKKRTKTFIPFIY